MFSTFRYFGSVMSVALLLCVTSADAGGILKGHPYRDPRAVVSAPSRYLESGPARWERDCCPDFGVHGISGSSLVPSGMPGMLSRSSYAANCPPVTNALLRVWVDDCATVWVNGVRTKPQFLAGVHRGSRVFSLTGLEVDEIREVVVQVAIDYGFATSSRHEKRVIVQAGQVYELRFPDLGEPFEDLPQPDTTDKD